MAVRLFTLWGRSEIEQLRQPLQEGLTGWRAKWLGAGKSPEPAIILRNGYEFEAADAPRALFQQQFLGCRDSGGKHLCAIRFAPRLLPALYASAVRDPAAAPAMAADPLAMQLTCRMLRDLLERIIAAAAAAAASGAPPHGASFTEYDAPPISSARGEGAVVVALTIEQIDAALYLAPDMVRSWVKRGVPRGAAQALSTRRAALADTGVSFMIEAGSAVLSLSDLAGLAPGQVVRLETGLGQPMKVRGAGSPAWCGAYLGLRDGTKAVQLCE
ncbi:MAG: hypothetical protein JWQ23_1776 [Herminiimonas sp.]|nr:hypothetical protein [Herminiimonas sp.]